MRLEPARKTRRVENHPPYYKAPTDIPRPLFTIDTMAIWIAIGITLGVAIGSMYGNVGIGIAIGVALGVSLGSIQRGMSRDDKEHDDVGR
jgi:hypothetical protein